MLLRRFTLMIALLLSTMTFVPDEKTTSEDTTAQMQERAVEMRRMEVEIHSMFAIIENPPPKPALTDIPPNLTDIPPNLTDIPLSHIWSVIAGFIPTYFLLSPIFYFWYLRNSGGKWMSMLYLLGIELEQGLGHDSGLFKVYAIALLFLQVANILSRRPVVSRTRRRTRTRTAPNPEMNRPSSNAADPPHRILPSVLSTALCELPAVHDNGPSTSTLPEDIVITTVVHLTGTVNLMMEDPAAGPEDGTFTSIPVEYSAIICVVETTTSRIITVALDTSIPETAPQSTFIDLIEVDDDIISDYPQSSATMSPEPMCPDGSLMAEDSSIIAFLSNGPPSSSFNDLMADDSAILAVCPERSTTTSPPAECTISSVMDEDSSIITVLDNGPQSTIDDWMAADSAIIAMCPETSTITSPPAECTISSVMDEDSSIITVLDNGPQSTIDDWMAADSAIIAVCPERSTITSPPAECTISSVMDEDSSIIIVLDNGPQSTIDDWMAADSAIFAMSPERCTITSPSAECTISSVMYEDSSIIMVALP